MAGDIAVNPAVFDVYLGLTASGYSLGNPTRVDEICALIETEAWPQQIRQYFRFARINDERINPYWPRASILTSVSLLLEHHSGSHRLDLVRKHLAKMENISPEEAGEDVVNWAAGLPDQTGLLRASEVYADVWGRYQAVVRDEIDQNGAQYNSQIAHVRGRLKTLLPLGTVPTQVMTLLNPLQADPLTDIVAIDNYIYVVTSHLRADSFIHELLHVSLEPYLLSWQDRILESAALLEPVYARMAHLTYAWDRSPDSWQNVFTETLVRVLTVLVSGGPQELQNNQIEQLVGQGFLYAHPIAKTITALEKGQFLSPEWLERCLRACAGAAARERKKLT